MTNRNDTPLNPFELAGSYHDLVFQTITLYKEGETEQAAALAQRLIDRISRLPERRRGPESELSVLLIAAGKVLTDIKAEQGDWDAVDALCQQLAPAVADPAHSTWPYRPWMLRVEQGNVDEGLAGLRACAEADPNNYLGWLLLMRSAMLAERLDVAEQAVQHCERLGSQHDDQTWLGEVNLARFVILRRRGEWHAAAAALELACSLDPELEEHREMAVIMFLEADLLDDALRYADDDVLEPQLANYFRALIAFQRGDRVLARHLWRSIIEGRFDAADEDGEEAVDSIPLRAQCHCWLGQPQAALALLLDGAWRDIEIEFLPALVLGLAWAMQGDAAAAEANLKLARQRLSSKALPDQLIPAFHWRPFEALVQDEAMKARLRPHFAVPAVAQ